MREGTFQAIYRIDEYLCENDLRLYKLHIKNKIGYQIVIIYQRFYFVLIFILYLVFITLNEYFTICITEDPLATICLTYIFTRLFSMFIYVKNWLYFI